MKFKIGDVVIMKKSVQIAARKKLSVGEELDVNGLSMLEMIVDKLSTPREITKVTMYNEVFEVNDEIGFSYPFECARKAYKKEIEENGK